MASTLKIRVHETTEDAYRFAKIVYTFKNPYGEKETFSDVVHFRDRIPADSIENEATESLYKSMRVNGYIPDGETDRHVVALEGAYGSYCIKEYSDADRPFKIDYTKYAKPNALRKFVTVVDVIPSNDMYDEFFNGDQYSIDLWRKRDKEWDEKGTYSESVAQTLSDADMDLFERQIMLFDKPAESKKNEKCSMIKKKESLLKTKGYVRERAEVCPYTMDEFENYLHDEAGFEWNEVDCLVDNNREMIQKMIDQCISPERICANLDDRCLADLED